jgi:broad specificity phosphatase PhoE
MEHLPIDIVLIRHGESEGNLAQSRSKKGEQGDWTQEFKERHTSRYRLTDKGRVQAEIAGKWVKENIAERFDRYYCSEYTRAMETASLLDMKGAKWFVGA